MSYLPEGGPDGLLPLGAHQDGWRWHIAAAHNDPFNEEEKLHD